MALNQGSQINITINGEGVGSNNEKGISQAMNDYLSTKDLSGDNQAISKDLDFLKSKVQGKEGLTDEEIEKGLAALVMLEAKRSEQWLAGQFDKMSDTDSMLLSTSSYVGGLENSTYDPSNPKTALEMTKKDLLRYVTVSDTNLADMQGAADLIPAITGKSEKDLHDMLKDKDEVLLPIGKTGAKLLIKRDHAQRDGNFSTTMKIVLPMHNVEGTAKVSGYDIVSKAIMKSNMTRQEKSRTTSTTPLSKN